jgi:hypothetical protein
MVTWRWHRHIKKTSEDQLESTKLTNIVSATMEDEHVWRFKKEWQQDGVKYELNGRTENNKCRITISFMKILKANNEQLHIESAIKQIRDSYTHHSWVMILLFQCVRLRVLLHEWVLIVSREL